MRPIKKPQSALKAPLNWILGTEASVRILRALSQENVSMGTGELAREAQLQPSGVRQTLDALLDHGILERVGRGRQRRVRLSTNHPLAIAIRGLFVAEHQRVEAVFSGIRSAAEELSTPPVSVWIEGAVATGKDSPGDAVHVGILTDSRELRHMLSELRAKVLELEQMQDVTIELRGYTEADFLAMDPAEQARLEDGLDILGPSPSSLFPRADTPSPVRLASAGRSHDERLRMLAELIAEKLNFDPTLVHRARAFISLRIKKASEGEGKELREWDQILRTMSASRLRRFLVDRGERATRLRRTLPFLDALTKEERNLILQEDRK